MNLQVGPGPTTVKSGHLESLQLIPFVSPFEPFAKLLVTAAGRADVPDLVCDPTAAQPLASATTSDGFKLHLNVAMGALAYQVHPSCRVDNLICKAVRHCVEARFKPHRGPSRRSVRCEVSSSAALSTTHLPPRTCRNGYESHSGMIRRHCRFQDASKPLLTCTSNQNSQQSVIGNSCAASNNYCKILLSILATHRWLLTFILPCVAPRSHSLKCSCLPHPNVFVRIFP